MQSVSRIWYHIYYGWMLLFSSSMLAASLAVLLLPEYSGAGEPYAIGMSTLLLSGMYVVYAASIYWIIRRRNINIAIFAGNWLFTTILMSGLSHAESQTAVTIYFAAWLVGVALMGMFGLPFLLMSVGFTGTYVLMAHDFQIANVQQSFVWLMAATALTALVTFQFWKRKYIDTETAQIRQLSGVIASKQVQAEILIQSIADGVLCTDVKGVINLINPGAAAITGWAQQDATGIDVRSVMKLAQENGTPIDDSVNPFMLALTTGQHSNQTLELAHAQDDAKSIISITVSPIINPRESKPVGAVAIFRDISKAREEEQRRAEFISTASHEMRTPVAAIEGYLALALNDRVTKIDARAREYLEKAHASTQHLGQLFQDLLTSAKAEDGRLTSHPEVVEMGSYLERLTEDLRFAAQKKGLYTEFLVGNGASSVSATNNSAEGPKTVRPLYYVYADPDRVREVITNLFDNAVKYTPSGKVSLGLTGDHDIVQIYVRDTGSGIPKEDIGHLFQKFYRVDSSATRTIGGTGLGLFICRKIIELYNGRIWVDSEVDKGSTFYINLPRLDSQKAVSMQASTSPEFARVQTAPSPPA